MVERRKCTMCETAAQAVERNSADSVRLELGWAGTVGARDSAGQGR